jgi:hypothetical protein
LPKTLKNRLGFIKIFRLSLTAINLFTITPYDGYDPENDFVPPTRQFVAGLNMNF